MTRVVIRDGRIVTAADDYVADILIEDGRVRTIGLELPADAAEVHHAGGLLVLPGGVDVHAHLDYDTSRAHTADSFATGTRAAAFGGTTPLFEGSEVTGRVEKVLSRGHLVVDRSVWLGAEGWGQYVGRSASECRDGGTGVRPSRSVARVVRG